MYETWLNEIEERVAKVAKQGRWTVSVSEHSGHCYVDSEETQIAAFGNRHPQDLENATFLTLASSDIQELLWAINDRDTKFDIMMRDEGFQYGVSEGIRQCVEKLNAEASRIRADAESWKGLVGFDDRIREAQRVSQCSFILNASYPSNEDPLPPVQARMEIVRLREGIRGVIDRISGVINMAPTGMVSVGGVVEALQKLLDNHG